MSANLIKLFFLIGVAIALPAFGLECPSNFKPEDVAKELLRAEFSGIRVAGMQNHKCLDQKRFPYLVIESDFSNEEPSKIFGYVSDMKDVKILKVESVDPTVYSYKVSFEVKVSSKKGDTSFQQKDGMSFFLYKDSNNQRIYGCGGVLSPPEKIYLFKDCSK